MRTTLFLLALLIAAPCAAQGVKAGPYVPGQPISSQTCRLKDGRSCPASSLRPIPRGTTCVCHDIADTILGAIE